MCRQKRKLLSNARSPLTWRSLRPEATLAAPSICPFEHYHPFSILHWLNLQSYQRSHHKVHQDLIKKATRVKYLAKRNHLETLKFDFKFGCV